MYKNIVKTYPGLSRDGGWELGVGGGGGAQVQV